MILVPLVFFSIVVGVSNLGKGKNSSLIWKSTLLYFVTTMSIAITLALVVMNIIQPGIGINIESWQLSDSLPSETITIPEFLKQFLLSLFANPFDSLASGKILPLIIFSIIIGIFFLNEKISFYKIITIILIFLGLVGLKIF